MLVLIEIVYIVTDRPSTLLLSFFFSYTLLIPIAVPLLYGPADLDITTGQSLGERREYSPSPRRCASGPPP